MATSEAPETTTADFVGRIRHEVENRLSQVGELLAEHEALLAEQRSLSKALDVLGENGSGPKPTPSEAPKRRRRRRRYARRGERAKQLAELVRENPDIKVRQIADALGVTPNNVYMILRRLEEQGVVERNEGKIILKASV